MPPFRSFSSPSCANWNLFLSSTSLSDRRSYMKAVDDPVPESPAAALGTFWTLTPQAVSAILQCGLDGLSSSDAERRLAQYGSCLCHLQEMNSHEDFEIKGRAGGSRMPA